jgi:hypothetical protein
MSAFSLYGAIYGLSLVSLALFRFIDRRFPNLKIMNHTIILALVIYYAFAIPGIVEAWALPAVTGSIIYAIAYGIIALRVGFNMPRYAVRAG